MKKTLILAISSIVLWSCNNNSEKTTSAQETVVQEDATHEEHHYNESSEALELNDGEKWIVNDEMKPFVAKQQELLNSYSQNNQTDYKELASQLQEQNQQLIQSCTMTGKSHDELHKWLHPHMALLVHLDASESKADADKLVSEINDSFETYHQHFQ